MCNTTAPANFKDAGKLLGVKDKRDRMLFACALYLGLRGTSELSRLKWGDVLGDRISVYQPKTGKTRRMVIPDGLKSIVEECYEGQGHDEFIFTGRRGTSGNSPLTNAGLNKIIRKYVSKFSIEVPGNDSSHFLRKTWARNYYENNGRTIDALDWLRRNLGHSHINTTLIYMGIDYEQQGERMNNVTYEG